MISVLAPGRDTPDMARFVDLPYALHRGDPGFVPPLRMETERLLSPSNPFFRYGQMQCFLAARGGQPAARCAAFVNSRLRVDGDTVGSIGLFDSNGDWEATREALAAAVKWLRARGMRRIWGPMDFSIFHGYRLMTAGFGTTPFYGEPRNPPGHPALLERFGFRPICHWRSWDLHVDDLRTRFENDRFPRAMARRGFGLREVSLERFDEELQAFHDIVIDGFRDNLGFSNIELDEFVSLYGGLRHIARPELMPLVVDASGSPAACAFIIPDVAPALQAAQGDAGRFAAAMASSPAVSRLVLHTMVVRRQARDRGLVQGFGTLCTARIVSMGYRTAVAAMVKPGFSVFDGSGEPTRQYTLYELAS